MLDLSWQWQALIFFVLAMLATALLILAWTGIFRKQTPEEDAAEKSASRELAARVAAFPQRVRNLTVTPRGRSAILELRANSDLQSEAHLIFFPSHPDFGRVVALEGLSKFSCIRFVYQDLPIEGQNEYDAVAYLRLKEGS